MPCRTITVAVLPATAGAGWSVGLADDPGDPPMGDAHGGLPPDRQVRGRLAP